jgi:hypothetical protein
MARSVFEIAESLGSNIASKHQIGFNGSFLGDRGIDKLLDGLCGEPNCTRRITLSYNQLTHASSDKLARYITLSTRLESLDLSHNWFLDETYFDIAHALKFNSSLRYLSLYDFIGRNDIWINDAFIHALRLNPCRPPNSVWYITYATRDEFEGLNTAAQECTSPSMLEFLLHVHSEIEIKPKLH